MKVIGRNQPLRVNKGIIICHIDPGRAVMGITGWDNNKNAVVVTVAVNSARLSAKNIRNFILVPVNYLLRAPSDTFWNIPSYKDRATVAGRKGTH